jgi:hypothetical protein
MHRQYPVSSVPTSVMAVISAVAGAVRADGGGYGYGRCAARPPYHAPYKPRHYPEYHPSCPCNNCGTHHHNNLDHDHDLWYGLPGGVLLGYTLGNVCPYSRADQGYFPPASAAPPPQA